MKGILLSVVLFCLPLAAFADGMVIPAVAYPAQVTIPDQRALICFSNGVERLVIETRFTGKGTNFAWVVPLPSQPVIEEATVGLFNTLGHIFRPRISHDVPMWGLFLLAMSGIVYLLVTVRRNTPVLVSEMYVSVLVALAIIPLSACVGIPLTVLLPYVVWKVRTGSISPVSILAVPALLILLGGMLLPILGTAGRSATDADVAVLNHEAIGAYDTTTIKAKEPQALLQWLHNHDYALPPAANTVVSNYVNRGWIFVATRLRRDAAGAILNAPQPLSFTFPTERAVYPMQLTGIGNTNLAIELFIFGFARAEAKFFHVIRCTQPEFPSLNNYFSQRSAGKIHIAHPLLSSWTDGLPVATQLKANLTSPMMVDDIEIHWSSFSEVQNNVFSYQGAAIYSLNFGAGLFIFILLVASARLAFEHSWKRSWQRVVLFAGVASIGVTVLCFLIVPKIKVRLTRYPAIITVSNLRFLGQLFHDSSLSNNVSSLTEARNVLKKIGNEYPRLLEQNRLLGGTVHEEDSPGNYALRQTTNGINFVWYDADGGEHHLDK